MKVELLYNDQKESVDVPDNNPLRILEPKEVQSVYSEEDLLKKALDSPISFLKFSEFLNRNKEFLIVINDHARSTPTPFILTKILTYLDSKDFKIIVACGTHPKPTEKDIQEIILGPLYHKLKDDIIFNNSKEGVFCTLGTTSRGTIVELNSIIKSYKAIIAINSIEPHYFAGFTGGRKSFVPGIASYSCVEANHSMALLEQSKIMTLENNPLHEDLEEAARMVLRDHEVYAINVILDGSGKIVGAFGGDILKQLYHGAKLATEIYAAPIDTKADILLAIVHPPFDQNLYQAQKGFENCKDAVKKGGILILVSSCYAGIGPDDYKQMLQSAKSPSHLAQKFEKIKKNYKLGWHKVGSIPPFLLNNKIWMVTTLPKKELDKMFIRGFSSIQSALNEALVRKGPEAQILIVNDSTNVCPTLKT